MACTGVKTVHAIFISDYKPLKNKSMKRTRIQRTGEKIVSTSSASMTFYLPKTRNVTVKRKTVYDLFNV